MADAVDTIFGINARYRADSITGAVNGGAIGVWPDTSGNGFNASPVAGPTLTANSINGQPAITFNGTSQLLTSSAPAGGVYQTVVAVIKPNVTGVNSTMRGGAGNCLQFRIGTTNRLQFVKQGTANIATSNIPITSGVACCVIGTYDSTTGAYAFYLNGADIGNGTSQYTLSASTTGVGATAAATEFFSGDIAELITYAKVLSAAERTAILGYVQTRYNILPIAPLLPLSETWTAGNGSSWPAQWLPIVTFGSGGGTDIRGNSGRITAGTVSSASIRQHLWQMVPTTDTDVVVSFTFASQIEGYAGVFIRSDAALLTGNNFFPRNGYVMQIACAATAANGTLSVSKSLSNGTTALGPTTITITAGTMYSVRFQCVGTLIRWKLWATLTGEPVAWLGSATDSNTLPPAGIVAVGAANGSASTTVYVTFNNLMVTPSNASLGYFDSFTGPNGVGWPGTWQGGTPAGKATITGNAGILTVNNSFTRRDLTMTPVDNADVMLTVTDNTSSSSEKYFWFGTNADTQETGSGNSQVEYYLQLNFNGTAANSSIQIWKGINPLGSAVTMTLSTNTAYNARFQKFGVTLRGKVWAANTSEPTAWTVSVTTSDASTTGVVSIGCQNTVASDSTFTVDNVSVMSSNGRIKVYNGSSFVQKPVKIWSGSAWQTKIAKRWDGAAWAYLDAVVPALAFVRQNVANPAITATPTATLPSVGQGHALILTIANWGPNPKIVNTMVDSAGGSWQRVASQSSANFGRQEIWLCSNHPGSSSTLTVTMTLESQASTAISLSEWSRPLSFNQAAVVNTTGTAPTATVTSAVNNLTLAAFSSANNSLPATTSPATALTTVTGANSYCANASAYVVSTDVSTTISYAAVSSTNYGILIGSFIVV